MFEKEFAMQENSCKDVDSRATMGTIRGAVDFLNLPGCHTVAVEYIEHMIIARASYDDIPMACPYCHASDLDINESETKDWLIWDAPHCGLHPTLIQLFVPSVTCLACRQKVKIDPPWLEYSLPKVDGTRARTHPTRTLRLIDYFLERITGFATFDQIALETCQSPDAIRSIFLERFKVWDDQRSQDLPSALGIDELQHRVDHKLQLVTILVDSSGDEGIVDVLSDRTNLKIWRRLLDAPNRNQVLNVTTDFSEPFRDVATKPITAYNAKSSKQKGDLSSGYGQSELFSAEELEQLSETTVAQMRSSVLGNAKPVVDHFHFAQKVQEAFNEVRNVVRKGMLEHYLELELASLSPENLRTMGRDAIDAHTSTKAKTRAEVRGKELFDKRWTFSKHPHKLTDEERLVVALFLAEFPLLQAGYELKNTGLDILHCNKSMEETEAALDTWGAKVEASIASEYFQPIKNLCEKWRPELIRFAETHLTNAKTEAKVGMLKLRNRLGRGVSFRMVRAIMIWSDAHRRKNRWPKCCGSEESMTARRFIDFLDRR